MTKNFAGVMTMVALLMALGVAATGQERMGGNDKMMTEAKPVVAIIRASWCPACQKIEPEMTTLMKQYGDRLTFVILDVTDEAKIKESEATAKKHGLTEFFKTHKSKTSTIAIFDVGQKEIFKTDHNYDRNAYVKAFDRAIEKHKMMKG
jgi:thiol-disulfide isomerase/thioredoxin